MKLEILKGKFEYDVDEMSEKEIEDEERRIKGKEGLLDRAFEYAREQGEDLLGSVDDMVGEHMFLMWIRERMVGELLVAKAEAEILRKCERTNGERGRKEGKEGE